MDDDAKIQLRLLWRICVRLKEHGQDSTLLWMDAVHAVYGGGTVIEHRSPTRCVVNGEVYDDGEEVRVMKDNAPDFNRPSLVGWGCAFLVWVVILVAVAGGLVWWFQ